MNKILSFFNSHIDLDGGGRGELFEKFQQKQKYNKDSNGLGAKR